MAAMEQNLTSRQNADLVDVLQIPEAFVSPIRRIVRRVIYALLVLAAAVLVACAAPAALAQQDDGGRGRQLDADSDEVDANHAFTVDHPRERPARRAPRAVRPPRREPAR